MSGEWSPWTLSRFYSEELNIRGLRASYSWKPCVKKMAKRSSPPVPRDIPHTVFSPQTLQFFISHAWQVGDRRKTALPACHKRWLIVFLPVGTSILVSGNHFVVLMRCWTFIETCHLILFLAPCGLVAGVLLTNNKTEKNWNSRQAIHARI